LGARSSSPPSLLVVRLFAAELQSPGADLVTITGLLATGEAVELRKEALSIPSTGWGELY